MMKLRFHPLIKPYVDSHASTLSAIFGWRLVTQGELNKILLRNGGNDRFALAAEVRKTERKSATFSVSKSLFPLVTGEYDHASIMSLQTQLLLGHCYETLKENNLLPGSSDPIREFYRHVRNGSFHGNKFYFKKGEPAHKAIWRGIEITKGHEGRRIFRQSLNEKGFLLNWGDALILLSDISLKIG